MAFTEEGLRLKLEKEGFFNPSVEGIPLSKAKYAQKVSGGTLVAKNTDFKVIPSETVFRPISSQGEISYFPELIPTGKIYFRLTDREKEILGVVADHLKTAMEAIGLEVLDISACWNVGFIKADEKIEPMPGHKIITLSNGLEVIANNDGYPVLICFDTDLASPIQPSALPVKVRYSNREINPELVASLWPPGLQKHYFRKLMQHPIIGEDGKQVTDDKGVEQYYLEADTLSEDHPDIKGIRLRMKARMQNPDNWQTIG